MKTKVIPVLSTVALALTMSACSSEQPTKDISETPIPKAGETPVNPENQETTPTQEELNENSITESAVNAVYDAYNEDIVFTDFDEEVSYYEIEFYDPSEEHLVEVHVSGNDLSVTEEEVDGSPDSDKLDKIDAVSVNIIDAIHTAETEGESLTEEFQLDENDGAVVYEFDLQNDREFDISVVTGEIVDQD